MQAADYRSIAVVDDDAAVRDSLRFLLETAGFPVTTFESAVQFLTEAKTGELTCLIVDQHMPETTGLQLIGQLRGQGDPLPIALMTGSPSPDVTQRAQALGVRTVLEKPLADDLLLQFIECAAAAG
jgi:FixJ family two-component response regulator